MNDLLPISACILVRDEEKVIDRCIVSLINVVREIIVVDTGSTDDTVNLVQKYPVKLLSFQWANNFSDARNFAIQHAKQPFVFMIDADEVLGEESICSLREFIKKKPTVPATVTISSIINEQKSVSSNITRIFPNNACYRYRGAIHEQLCFQGRALETTRYSNVKLLHDGYQKAKIQNKSKIERNIMLLQEQLKIEPDSVYFRFQIGQTLFVDQKYKEAVLYFDDALRMLSKEHSIPKYISTLFLSYGYCLFYNAEFDSLDLLLQDAIDFFPNYTDLYFLYGLSLIQRKEVSDLVQIKEVFEYCMQLGEITDGSYESVEGVGSYRALYNLGVYYEVTNQQAEAKKCYSKSAEAGFVPAVEGLERVKTVKA
ncbi:glycosyltransferase family 2 protein [Paenibacillus sp. FSL W8-0187]|uniref:glycosyltransferase family 2 protein n=1 Tax=Paenibacillus TaxID=44249 RepID=UPI0030D93683